MVGKQRQWPSLMYFIQYKLNQYGHHIQNGHHRFYYLIGNSSPYLAFSQLRSDSDFLFPCAVADSKIVHFDCWEWLLQPACLYRLFMSLAWALLKSGPTRTQVCNQFMVRPCKQTINTLGRLGLWLLSCIEDYRRLTCSFLIHQNVVPSQN